MKASDAVVSLAPWMRNACDCYREGPSRVQWILLGTGACMFTCVTIACQLTAHNWRPQVFWFNACHGLVHDL